MTTRNYCPYPNCQCDPPGCDVRFCRCAPTCRCRCCQPCDEQAALEAAD